MLEKTPRLVCCWCVISSARPETRLLQHVMTKSEYGACVADTSRDYIMLCGHIRTRAGRQDGGATPVVMLGSFKGYLKEASGTNLVCPDCKVIFEEMTDEEAVRNIWS